MLHNPEAMKKAQEELDRVIGTERLPDFEDADDLPYIDAIIKETTRCFIRTNRVIKLTWQEDGIP